MWEIPRKVCLIHIYYLEWLWIELTTSGPRLALAAGSVLMSNEKTIRVNLVGNIARKGFVVYDALLFSLAIGCISKDEGNWVSIGCGKCLLH